MRNRIRDYRVMHGLGREAFATRLGVNRQTIVAIENGKYEPSLDLALRIAHYFGVTIEEIFLND